MIVERGFAYIKVGRRFRPGKAQSCPAALIAAYDRQVGPPHTNLGHWITTLRWRVGFEPRSFSTISASERELNPPD